MCAVAGKLHRQQANPRNWAASGAHDAAKEGGAVRVRATPPSATSTINAGSNAHFLSVQMPLYPWSCLCRMFHTGCRGQMRRAWQERHNALCWPRWGKACPQCARRKCQLQPRALSAFSSALPTDAELPGLGQPTRHLGRVRAAANAVLRQVLRAFCHGRQSFLRFPQNNSMHICYGTGSLLEKVGVRHLRAPPLTLWANCDWCACSRGLLCTYAYAPPRCGLIASDVLCSRGFVCSLAYVVCMLAPCVHLWLPVLCIERAEHLDAFAGVHLRMWYTTGVLPRQ